jgi:hypothetical protein
MQRYPFFLAPVLLLAACSSQRTSVMLDPALLPLIPSDTISLGGIRFDAFQKTETWKRLAASPQWTERMDEFTKEVGFDPRKDLMEVLWASDGKESLFFVRNRFSQMNIEPLVRREGYQRLAYKGYPLLGDEEYAALFMNASTAVVGRTARLRKIIDNRDAGPGTLSKELLAKAETIPAGAHLWMVATPSALPKFESDRAGTSNMLANLPRLLNGVQYLTVALDMTKGVDAQAVAYCVDDQCAKQWQNTIKGLAGIARITLPEAQRAQMLPLLDSVEVQLNGTTTTTKFKLDLAALEQLQSTFSGAGSRRPN